MGTNSSKNKNILQILENNITKPNTNAQENLKIEYKINYDELKDEEENLKNRADSFDSDDPFELDYEYNPDIYNTKFDVKNTNKYPYCSIGTISVQFPVSLEVFTYTCFLIDSNVVVTLASNLDNRSKGGRATSIETSFSKEKVKQENIYIQGEEKLKNKKVKYEEKKQNEDLDNIVSKLAVILYEDNINNKWIGVETGKREDFNDVEKYVTFSFSEIEYNYDEFWGREKKINQSKFREIYINHDNPFLRISKRDDD